MSLPSLLIRFSLVFIVSYFVVMVLMIFIIALLQLPPVFETFVPYVLVWVVSFYVINQYHEKNRQILSKNQRWKIIFLLTITALLIGLAFNTPVYSEDMARDIQRLLFGILFSLPAYAVLIWSAEYRASKRLLKNYPELKNTLSK
ncbi:hypothetical protein MNBD_GAMMA04-1432 [hydrothermal vent metagenome]|uniref:Uncharacterized protein n=1 Tax=hydrothermal vent metagenome TaxID=652676 RepID=A0A3B0WK02_9ZZZZ